MKCLVLELDLLNQFANNQNLVFGLDTWNIKIIVQSYFMMLPLQLGSDIEVKIAKRNGDLESVI